MTPRKKVAKPKKKAVRKPTQPKESGMARDQSRVDQGRREIGARIHNAHVPSKDREGDGATTSTIPSSIVVTVPIAPVLVGQNVQLVATVENAAGQVLSGITPDSWTSTDPGIATVDGNGLVTGIAAGGPIFVTAHLDTLNSSDVPVSVAAMVDTTPAAITIPISLTLSSGTHQLTATIANAAGGILDVAPTSWTSADEAVVTVDGTGLVTFVGVGGPTDVVAHYNAIASNVCAVTGAASGSPGLLIVSHDFEDGTLGPFYNPWGIGIDVVSDPTARATGKVCRIQYATNPPAGQLDSNLAIDINPTGSQPLGLGQERWFEEDLYIDSEVASGCQRKLFYWGWSNDSWGFQHAFSLVLTSFDTQFYVSAPITGPSADPTFGNTQAIPGFTGRNDGYVDPAVVALTRKAWHKLKVHLTINSTFSATDGALQMWLDDVLFFDHGGARWTDPLWTDDPATYQWVRWNVGDQLDTGASGLVVSESRYLDNVKFATTEAALG